MTDRTDGADRGRRPWSNGGRIRKLRDLRRKIGVLWELYRPVRPLIGLYMLASAFGTLVEGLALGAIAPLIGGSGGAIGVFLDDVIATVGLDPDDDLSLVYVVGGLFVLRAVAQYFSGIVAGVMTRRQSIALQVELFRLYMNVRWEIAQDLSQGEANLLLNNHTQVAAQFLRRCMSLAEGAVYTIGLTAVAIAVSPENTFLAIGLIGSTALGVGIVAGRLRRFAEGILETSKTQASVLLQYARGIQPLRVFGVADAAVADIERLARHREALAYRSNRVGALARVLPDLLFVLALLAIVGLAARSGDGVASVGAVVALLFRVSQYLKRFSEATILSSLLPTVQDLHKRRKEFRANAAPSLTLREDASLTPGAIELRSLTYRYPDSPDVALTDITASVARGEFIGVVGSSGSGKSTLVNVIVGLLEPTSGSVAIGGLSEGGGLAYVPQTPFILRGSIAFNVKWFRDLDDERVESACRRAGLGSLLDRLPEGLDTEIGQEGLTISGGERQRLALARALADDPTILVLDEATSALDGESEKAIQQSLIELRGRTTVLAVAHRLSTVLDSDRIWVIENGALVENAAPDELLRTAGSRFGVLGALQGLTAATDD